MLQNFTGALLQTFKYIIGFLSSSPVYGHPFQRVKQKGRGGLGTLEGCPYFVKFSSTSCSKDRAGCNTRPIKCPDCPGTAKLYV